MTEIKPPLIVICPVCYTRYDWATHDECPTCFMFSEPDEEPESNT